LNNLKIYLFIVLNEKKNSKVKNTAILLKFRRFIVFFIT